MDDLSAAKQILKDKELNIVFVKNSQPIFETSKEGLSGFLKAIQEFNKNLSGASVADRIIGRAAALLCAYSNVKAAYAITMSKNGLNTFDKFNIPCEFEILTPKILNLRKDNICPLEKLVERISNPKEAYIRITRFYSS